MKPKKFGIVVALALTPYLAFGWGAVGHSTMGQIIEDNLSPKAKAMVQSILGLQPLSTASNFPDYVRDDIRYEDFAPYHFVEIPDGMTYATLAPEWRLKKDGNAFLAQVPAILKDATVSRDRKMILLIYLIHIAEDVHQPLHVGNGYDRGANMCKIKWNNPLLGKLEATNLHTFWDDKIFDVIHKQVIDGGFKGYFKYVQVMENILATTPKPGPAEITNSLDTWYADAQALRGSLYPEKPSVADPRDRLYCDYVDPVTHKPAGRKIKESDIPTLSDEYVKESLATVKSQILKGGLRIAKLLNEVGEEYKGSTTAFEKEKDLLSGLHLVNP